jgi:hypothetical protein
MPDRVVLKIVAWTGGVLVLLWLLVNCLGPRSGGPATDPAGPERDPELYLADCQRAYDALELVAELRHENADYIVDELDFMSGEVTDPELAELVRSFGLHAQDITDYIEPGDDESFEDAYQVYRGFVEIELRMRCSAVYLDYGSGP